MVMRSSQTNQTFSAWVDNFSLIKYCSLNPSFIFIGAIVYELIHLKRLQKRDILDKIKIKIQNTNKYSERLIILAESMLEMDANDRISFDELFTNDLLLTYVINPDHPLGIICQKFLKEIENQNYDVICPKSPGWREFTMIDLINSRGRLELKKDMQSKNKG
jgi:hypothetical protein